MDSEWLRSKLKAHKITQRSLGEAIGLTQDKVNKVLAHVRIISPIEALKAAEFLQKYGISRNEVLRAFLGKEAELFGLSGAAEQSPPAFQPLAASTQPQAEGEKGVPLVGEVGANGQVTIYGAASMPPRFADYVPYSGPHTLRALRVAGNALYPVHHNGDLLYFEDHGMVDNLLSEKECVVKLKDGRHYLKTVKRGSFPGSYTLEAFNTAPIENAELEWASRVYWVKRA